MFFLRRPRRKAAAPVEPDFVVPEVSLESESSLAPLATTTVVDDTPDELPGVPDLYAIVGVDPASSDELIRYAYRRKAAKLHERRWRPGQAVRQLAELNAAYEILGKPDRRADYDRRLARRAAYDRSFNGAVEADETFKNGRALTSGQRHERRRLRLVPTGGVLEVVVILAVVALAIYAAAALLSTRSFVDLSKVVEVGDSLGLSTRRRATPSTSATPAPTAALPATGAIISPPSSGTAAPSANRPDPTPASTPASPATAPQPMSRFSGSTVSVSDASPNPRSQVSIVGLILRDGKPVPGSEVYSIVHYRTVDERWPAGSATRPTDANGTVTISFNVGDATAGHPVTVDLIANVDGEQVQLQTSFTPR